MKKHGKWAISLLLVFAMLVSMTGGAFAAEAELPENPIASDVTSEVTVSDDTITTEISEEAASADVAEETETEASGEEYIAPGVWSDADPYWTEDVPAEDASVSAAWSGPRRAAAQRNASYPTYEEAYQRMVALMDEMPEGMTWTNFEPYGSKASDPAKLIGYRFQAGPVKGASLGVGCAAFCFILSDRTFPGLPMRVVDEGDFEFEDIRVGDFLRVNSSHFVTVLRVTTSGVVVAEGNFNSTVHWGRAISRAEIMVAANFLVSRYPADYSEAANPDEVIASSAEHGKAGSLDWTLTKGGTLTITGNGPIPDYDLNDESNLPPWQDKGSIYAVELESGVTSVGDFAFYRQKDLLNVYLSDTVERIGQSAFYGAGLVGVSLPANVKYVADDAFHGCANLTSVDIADGVETIGERAFMSCSALKFVDFPGSIKQVGAGAFSDCLELVQVRFMPNRNNIVIGADLFANCWRLQLISLPEGITAIPPGLFGSCQGIVYLYIPSTVTSIAEAGQADPFMGCKGVGTIYFGGTQSEWDQMANNIPPALYATNQIIKSAQVVVERADPFVPDPDDPGDLKSCENGHVGPADENGNCMNCGEPMNNEPVDPNPPIDPDPPAKHEHDWASVWTSDANHHWHECEAEDCLVTVNAEKDGYAEHEYGKWTIDANATAEQAGSRHRDCVVCTYRQTETIPATGGSVTEPGGGSTEPSDPNPPINPGGGGSGGPSGGSSGSSSGGSSSGGSGNTGGSGTVKPETKPTVTTIQNADGTVTTQVTLPATIIEAAEKRGEATALPIPTLNVGNHVAIAPMITVQFEKDGPVKVAIPVENPRPGMVAMLIGSDASTNVVKTSVVVGDNLVVSLPGSATVRIIDNSKEFADVVSGAWYGDAVDFVSARELFAGTSATTFAPEAPMTRAMLMTVLARFDGVDTAGGATWYAKATEWAVAHSVSDGSNPDGNITREQLVAMLWRYCGSPTASGDLSGYTDVGQVSEYAQEAMRWAVESGIINGFGDGRLGPQGQATRAQVAQILKNLITSLA